MDIRNTPFWNLLMISGLASSGGLIEDSATGNPVVFNTDVAKPLQKLSLSLLPRQEGSGDPSPENVRDLIPWGDVGTWHGGKNLLNTQAGNDLAYRTYNKYTIENGSVIVTGSTLMGFKVACKPSTRYAFSFSRTFENTNMRVYGYEEEPESYEIGNQLVNVDKATSASFVTGANHNWLICGFYANTDDAVISDIQLEVGSQSTAFVPYSPITPHPVNLRKNLVNQADGKTSAANWWIGSDTVNAEPDGTFTLDAGTYTLSVSDKQSGIYVRRNGTNIVAVYNNTKATFTLAEKTPVRLMLYKSGVTVAYWNTINIQLEQGDTPSAFQPYLPPVYGCSVDLTTGEVWGTWKTRTFTGASSENWYFTQVGSSAWYRAYINMPDMKQENDVSILADSYKAVSFDNRSFSQKVCMASNVTDNPQVISIITEETSVENFTAYLAENPLTIAYKLSTPVLLATLDPQQIESLIGTNTIWTDGDNVDVTFLKKK